MKVILQLFHHFVSSIRHSEQWTVCNVVKDILHSHCDLFLSVSMANSSMSLHLQSPDGCFPPEKPGKACATELILKQIQHCPSVHGKELLSKGNTTSPFLFFFFLQTRRLIKHEL